MIALGFLFLTTLFFIILAFPSVFSLSLSSICVGRIMRSNQRGNILTSHDKSRLNSSKKNTKLCVCAFSSYIFYISFFFFLCLYLSGFFYRRRHQCFKTNDYQHEYRVSEDRNDTSK